MAGSRERTSEQEAATWLARLQSRSISVAELEEFTAWRQDPENAAEYERAQAIWEQSGRLSNDPDIQRALHGDAKPRRRWDSVVLTHPALMLAIVAVAISLTIGILSGRPSTPASNYETAVGERSSVRLTDGSTLQLDTDSQVAVLFDEDLRRIELKRGQAFFRVAHSVDRPFVVDAGDDLTVTATGTEFDVQRLPDRIRVALVKGGVVVRRDTTELARLRPGSVVDVSLDGGATPARKSVSEAVSWQRGHLSFRETPLAEAVRDMNRYNSVQLRILDEAARNETVSGEFSVDDPHGFKTAVDTLLGDGTLGI